MLGIYLALSAAVVLVSADALKKIVGGAHHPFAVVWCTVLAGLLINIVAAASLGVIEIDRLGWLSILPLSIACMALGEITFIRAITKGDFSAVAPLRAAGPVFSLILGFLLFEELPSSIAFVGVAAVIGGVWMISASKAGFHFAPGALDMIAAQAFGVGLGASIRIASTDIHPLFFFCFVLLGELLVMSVVLWFTKIDPLTIFQPSHRIKALWLCVLWGLGIAALHIAPSFTQVAYAQASSQVYLPISLLISWWFLGERDVGRKIIPSLIILAGIGFIIFGAS